MHAATPGAPARVPPGPAAAAAEVPISFLTSLHDCLDYTKAYLESLEQTVTMPDYEVVLVDDASRDGTAEFLRSLPRTRYRVLTNERNRGFAHSNNLAAAHARGRLLCFLNNDTVLRPGWLEPMLELLETEPDVGAVGNIQIDPRSGLVDHAGVFFDLKGRPTHAWMGRRRHPPGRFGEWNAVTAACLLMRASSFRDLEGFDEAYRNSFEDVDLCVRMRRRGLRLLVSHESVIEHYGRASPGRKRHDAENIAEFLRRWRDTTARWGRREWPRQYLLRHARQWWRMRPERMLLALLLLATGRGG